MKSPTAAWPAFRPAPMHPDTLIALVSGYRAIDETAQLFPEFGLRLDRAAWRRAEDEARARGLAIPS